MKKDWSVVRITFLLYFIVVLMPLNYYLAKESFNSMRSDAVTMNYLVSINGMVQALPAEDDLSIKKRAIKEIYLSLEEVENKFINFSPNKEYVTLFRAGEIFVLLKETHKKLEKSIDSNAEIKAAASKMSSEISSFSKTVQDMMLYKSEMILNKLYISLAFTMLLIIILIFIVRIYMKLQFIEHTIHDHVTGLYNKKYFESVLQNSKELAIRHNRPLSLLVLSINNYNELKESFNKAEFEEYLRKFGTVFSNFFRHSDTLCRIEENCFVSIAPDASVTNIKELSLRLEQELQSKLFDSKILPIVSIGVTTCEDCGSLSLLEEARKNMQNCSIIELGGAS